MKDEIISGFISPRRVERAAAGSRMEMRQTVKNSTHLRRNFSPLPKSESVIFTCEWNVGQAIRRSGCSSFQRLIQIKTPLCDKLQCGTDKKIKYWVVRFVAEKIAQRRFFMMCVCSGQFYRMTLEMRCKRAFCADSLARSLIFIRATRENASILCWCVFWERETDDLLLKYTNSHVQHMIAPNCRWKRMCVGCADFICSTPEEISDFLLKREKVHFHLICDGTLLYWFLLICAD